jgi:hypothetical protein
MRRTPHITLTRSHNRFGLSDGRIKAADPPVNRRPHTSGDEPLGKKDPEVAQRFF